jgi:hypothetical protein
MGFFAREAMTTTAVQQLCRRMYRERRREIRRILDEERGKAARGVSAQNLVLIGPVRYEPGNEYSIRLASFSALSSTRLMLPYFHARV